MTGWLKRVTFHNVILVSTLAGVIALNADGGWETDHPIAKYRRRRRMSTSS